MKHLILGVQFARDRCAAKSVPIHTQARQYSYFSLPDYGCIVLHESGFCPSLVFDHIRGNALSILPKI